MRARFVPKLPAAGRYEVRLFYAPSSNRAANALVLNLDVRASQEAAIQLYQSLGYQHWGSHPRYARVGEDWVAGFYFWKDLAIPNP